MLNRFKLPFFALAVFLAQSSYALESPTIYGNLNVSIDRVEFETLSEKRVLQNSNESYFGITGEEDLDNALSLIYRLEWGVDLDGDNETSHLNPSPADTAQHENTLVQRNQYFGIRGAYGEILLGHKKTPMELSIGPVDLFNGQTMDMDRIVTGANFGENATQISTPLLYKYVKGHYMMIPGEDTIPHNGANDYSSSAIVFDNESVYVAFGFDNEMPGAALNQDRSRFSVAFTIVDFQIGIMGQKSEVENQDASTSGLISLSYKRGKDTFKAQGVEVRHTIDEINNIINIDKQGTLGVERSLGENTAVYFNYSELSYEVSNLPDGKRATLGLSHSF